MKIKVNGAQLPIEFIAMENVGVDDWAVKTDFESKEVKFGHAGKPISGTRKAVVIKGENGIDRSATFSVVEPVALEEMTKYRAEGDVFVTHYVDDRTKRLAVSLQVQKLVPIKG